MEDVDTGDEFYLVVMALLEQSENIEEGVQGFGSRAEPVLELAMPWTCDGLVLSVLLLNSCHCCALSLFSFNNLVAMLIFDGRDFGDVDSTGFECWLLGYKIPLTFLGTNYSLLDIIADSIE